MTPLLLDYPISVGILFFASRGPDGDDTRETVQAITKALQDRGHTVHVREVHKKNWRSQLKIPGDVVFNLVEDESWDLYRKVADKLTQMGRAVVGMTSRSLPYSTQKAKVIGALRKSKVLIPKSKVIYSIAEAKSLRGLEFPMIVKPSGEHSGWGITQESVVIDKDELSAQVKYILQKFGGSAIVEEYIEGREIHVTVIGNDKYMAVLPYIEVEFSGEFADNWNVYTYDAKWEEKSWEYWASEEHLLTRLDKKLDTRIQMTVKRAFRASKSTDIARFDLRINDKGQVYVIDVNVCPGMNPVRQSPSVRSALALGWNYGELVETLVAVCYKRVYGALPDRLRARTLLLGAPRLLG